MAYRRNNPFVDAVMVFAAEQQHAYNICNEIQEVINGRGIPVLFFFDSSKNPVCIETSGPHADIAKGIVKKEEKTGTVLFQARESVGDTVYCGNDAIEYLDCLGMMTPELWKGIREEAVIRQ